MRTTLRTTPPHPPIIPSFMFKRFSTARRSQFTQYIITTTFPRIFARTYYAHPRARDMSFSCVCAHVCTHVCVHARVCVHVCARV